MLPWICVTVKVDIKDLLMTVFLCELSPEKLWNPVEDYSFAKSPGLLLIPQKTQQLVENPGKESEIIFELFHVQVTSEN